MNYCIKGNHERGTEVIALLESKGGNNEYSLFGNGDGTLFYIRKDGVIDCASTSSAKDAIRDLCEELTLPEKWEPKFKIGDEVIYPQNSYLLKGKITDIYYDLKGYIIKDNFIEEPFVSLYKWEPQQGERILVRDSDIHIWREGDFSFKDTVNDIPLYYTVGGLCWNQCAPFDINKLGKI